MNWETIPLGPIQTNCHLLYNDKKEAVVFDPGGDADVLYDKIHSLGLKPQAVLLTHAHFDHIGAVDAVRETYDVPVYVHHLEDDWLTNPEKNGSSLFLDGGAISASKADHLITEEGILSAGSFSFEVIETPGHSPGSVSYYCGPLQTVFSGDVLFAGAIGRTDLPGGDHAELLHVLHDKMLELPEDTHVACGHGPSTTISAEMDSNPFLNGF
ncbi:MBL fold metallo-hydrolase [Salibacterium halotolerans]|uniref:Glyoxylase, beta-lactamase superfamily II n=1 Tax=Salibacterium halotolerans TaxID=1884432 RepID=A0A1I5NLV4_9BACI|nr:MBL fold metallo-hydrolase [Salibacterium halotolerans]SFP22620.1 Glyoxylase, beta-lactamase superfamily II [Salibacterium halotolerans]